MKTVLVVLCSLYYLVVPKFLCYVWDTFVVKQYLVPSISYKTMFVLYITCRVIIELKTVSIEEIARLRNIYNRTKTSKDLQQDNDKCLATIYSILIHFTQLAIAYVIIRLIQ